MQGDVQGSCALRTGRGPRARRLDEPVIADAPQPPPISPVPRSATTRASTRETLEGCGRREHGARSAHTAAASASEAFDVLEELGPPSPRGGRWRGEVPGLALARAGIRTSAATQPAPEEAPEERHHLVVPNSIQV